MQVGVPSPGGKEKAPADSGAAPGHSERKTEVAPPAARDAGEASTSTPARRSVAAATPAPVVAAPGRIVSLCALLSPVILVPDLSLGY